MTNEHKQAHKDSEGRQYLQDYQVKNAANIQKRMCNGKDVREHDSSRIVEKCFALWLQRLKSDKREAPAKNIKTA